MSKSLLDPGQILQEAFDEPSKRLKVDAAITAPSATSVIISDADDSIKIGDGTGTFADVTVANALKVDGSAVTQPISAASLPLPTGAATESTLSTLNGRMFASTATITTVARNAASVTVLAANASRKGLLLHNDTAAICYVSYAATSTTTTYTFRLTANGFYEMQLPVYTGVISVIWGSGGALNLNVTELT